MNTSYIQNIDAHHETYKIKPSMGLLDTVTKCVCAIKEVMNTRGKRGVN